MNRARLYVGCSLTHAPEEFKRDIEWLKNDLKKSFEVYDFLGLKKGSVREVYLWDVKRCVAQCDLFIAICDHASIGLGYELGAAVEAFDKPVLAVAHKETRVTRLILGIASQKFTFKRYDKLDDLNELIKHKLAGSI